MLDMTSLQVDELKQIPYPLEKSYNFMFDSVRSQRSVPSTTAGCSEAEPKSPFWGQGVACGWVGLESCAIGVPVILIIIFSLARSCCNDQ